MALNIKNSTAHTMALQLAQKTGESVTDAVTEAIRERLARIRETGRNDSRGDLDANGFSFASAIHDRNGEVVAAARRAWLVLSLVANLGKHEVQPTNTVLT